MVDEQCVPKVGNRSGLNRQAFKGRINERCQVLLVRVEGYERMHALEGSIIGSYFRVEMELALVVVLFKHGNTGIIAGRLDGQRQQRSALSPRCLP
jgi:hypothetical protein